MSKTEEQTKPKEQSKTQPFELKEAQKEQEDREEAPIPADQGLASQPYEPPSKQLEAGRKFLAKYGVDQSELSDQDVIEVVERIRTARKEATQVLSRGQTLDMMEKVLDRYVPDGFIGQFKGDNDASIARARALGFEILYDERAKKETATGSADGRIRVGDLILMVIPVEQYIGNRLAKEDRYRERRKRRKSNQRAKNETQDKDSMIPVFGLDQLESVGAEED